MPRRWVNAVCLFGVLLSLVGCRNGSTLEEQGDAVQKIRITYPDIFRDTTRVDVYHGKKIADPYHWLEIGDSPWVQDWLEAQRNLTANYLSYLPQRSALQERLRKLWDHERYEAPVQRGAYYYHLKNDGLQDQAVLYRSRGLYGKLDTVFNPNTAGIGQLHDYSFSPNGRWAAIQHAEAGSDWQQVSVIDLRTGELREDRLDHLKYSNLAWYGNGFFYSRYPAPNAWELRELNEFHQLYYHRLGRQQEEDALIFADRIHPQRNVYGETTADGRYLVISLHEGPDGNAVYFKDAGQEDTDFTPIYSDFAYSFRLVGNQGRQLYFLTNYGAPNGRIMRVDVRYPQPEYWEEIIPQQEDVLADGQLTGGRFITTYLHNAVSEMKLFDLEGKLLREISLEGKGTILKPIVSPESSEAFFTYTSFTQPESIYRLDLRELTVEVYRTPEIDFNSEAYTTRQIWYESYDGQRVPMFIIHRKGIDLDGSNPTLLVGDGSLQHLVLPQFNLSGIHLFPAFLERGGICAVANIRGGGEFGKKWYDSGSGDQKQTAFDDFQAAAEYLIANKYTTAKQLGIYGRSTGGLLVGVSLTQRPELYAAAVPEAGILDMLRYHRFTTGWTWSTDYGTSERPEDFEELLRYSPLHNIKADAYPATLVLTREKDDRAVPVHSYKFVSELQAKQEGDAPILIRVDREGGHDGLLTINDKIEEGADVLAFLWYHLGT
ncbi:prolyl oligopeptidase family serine peptidase [Flavilitoribacter nigricans]|uniref:prolyl oligopeptidase family serine peptidase n=1 Tax=Flavilitoribacter nigricans TaxID=70997 RepID=UPI0014734F57|nr:prolyl oligopeptidase family serine peptidase [Flavilitoribacter nigricans]